MKLIQINKNLKYFLDHSNINFIFGDVSGQSPSSGDVNRINDN